MIPAKHSKYEYREERGGKGEGRDEEMMRKGGDKERREYSNKASSLWEYFSGTCTRQAWTAPPRTTILCHPVHPSNSPSVNTRNLRRKVSIHKFDQ
jgi:hypothetical protein